ncbi:MAG TPA: GAF domain-containing protein [Rubrobacteraceae bacterium]|nr:GAF domain-containing protein [Rubrobacteraceae bacterium]
MGGEAGYRWAETLEEILSVFREAFEMDVAFISEFVGEDQVFRVLEGERETFGIEEGTSLPLEGSICQRVVDGRVPNAIPDTRADERVKDLDITRAADVGSYVGFPLRLSDGRLYGTLCCASHSPDPWLRDRDLRLVRDLADRATARLEREGML